MNAQADVDSRLAGTTLLNVRAVSKLLGVSPRQIWRLVPMAEAGQGDFPRPLRLGTRTVRWPVAAMESYVAAPAEGGGDERDGRSCGRWPWWNARTGRTRRRPDQKKKRRRENPLTGSIQCDISLYHAQDARQTQDDDRSPEAKPGGQRVRPRGIAGDWRSPVQSLTVPGGQAASPGHGGSAGGILRRRGPAAATREPWERQERRVKRMPSIYKRGGKYVIDSYDG